MLPEEVLWDLRSYLGSLLVAIKRFLHTLIFLEFLKGHLFHLPCNEVQLQLSSLYMF